MIKGILLDKDGTILNFYKMWFSLCQKAIAEVAARYGVSENLPAAYEAVGMKDGALDAVGLLACGTFEQIVSALKAVLFKGKSTPDGFSDMLQNTINHAVFKTKPEPTCDLKALFSTLHEKGLKVGLATSDTKKSAEYCAKQLGIFDELDFFGSDDGKTNPKPAPDMIFAFCSAFGFTPDEVIMAGDTVSDMRFAKNAGAHAVGITCGVSGKEALSPYAEAIIDTPYDLLTLSLLK